MNGKMNLMRSRILLCLLILFVLGKESIGQNTNSFNARMSLSSVDTSSMVACYDLQISGGNQVEWILGSFNIIMLYDARTACYRSDTLLHKDESHTFILDESTYYIC